jgi:PKD domain
VSPLAALLAFFLASFPHTCSWVFPGGSPASSASCEPPAVVFQRPGPKRVTLTVCAGPFCNSAAQTLEVLDPRPRIVRIDSQPQTAYGDEPVTLTAEAAGKPALAYSWRLPDGSTLSGNPVTVSPEKLSPSSASVRLTVTNPSGSAARTFTPKILSPSPRVRSVSLSPNPAYPQSTITATAEATGRPPLTYRWTFPDGQIVAGPSVTWTVPDLQPRSYPVVLEVSNAAGSASTRRSLRVLAPVALRSFEPVCPGACIFRVDQAVRFEISTTVATPRFEIDWDGNGTYDETVTTLNPTHTYTSPGFLRPRARVRLPDGRLEIRSTSRILTITR